MSDMERLPCGCLMGTDEKTMAFLYEPCALDCKYYQYVLKQAKELGKPMTILDAR